MRLINISQLVIGGMLSIAPVLQANTTAPNADNTEQNKYEGTPERPTADQQSNDPKDIELARKIRSLVVKDKSLSVNAHNIKIITHSGAVVLKGPVESTTELQRIENLAHSVDGVRIITNQLEVKTAH